MRVFSALCVYYPLSRPKKKLLDHHVFRRLWSTRHTTSTPPRHVAGVETFDDSIFVEDRRLHGPRETTMCSACRGREQQHVGDHTAGSWPLAGSRPFVNRLGLAARDFYILCQLSVSPAAGQTSDEPRPAAAPFLSRSSRSHTDKEVHYSCSKVFLRMRTYV